MAAGLKYQIKGKLENFRSQELHRCYSQIYLRQTRTCLLVLNRQLLSFADIDRLLRKGATPFETLQTFLSIFVHS